MSGPVRPCGGTGCGAWRRQLLRALAPWLAVAAFGGALPVAGAAPPSIDDFFRPAELAEPALSPSGRYLAAVAAAPDGHTRLVVLDLDQPGEGRNVAGFADADLADAHWLDDERLVFSADDRGVALDERRPGGLWAVNRDGSGARQLIKRAYTGFISTAGSHIVGRVLEPDHRLRAIPGDDAQGAVVVEQMRWDSLGDPQGTVLKRLDTLTGVAHAIEGPPDAHVVHWMFDVHGRPRAALAASGNRQRLWWHADDNAAWTLLDDRAGDGVSTHWSPLWADGSTLYVLAASRTGMTALFGYDTAARQLQDEPLLSIDGFDYDGERVVDRASGRVIGLRYAADAEGTHWFDPAFQRYQQTVDGQLPGAINTLSCNRCVGAPRLLVSSRSDRQPPVYYLFETSSGRLERIGAARPWIDAKQMADQDFVRIRARDGADLPVYVTKPRGKADGLRPAVVLVHGGPQVRGNVWGWSAEAQFLASRGYVVIEPEFRGGTGFGARHFAAGFRQWGLTMQDDVTDATRWAIREAGVDPQRICIAGASYGGYATLMGLVREPQLYRCGVEWVGVTDLGLLFGLSNSDMSEDWKRYGLRTLLGDPTRDAERFAQTSPVAQAARITQPLLMAYGAADRRVPLEHGQRLRQALGTANPNVEWVVYADEGHGFGAPEHVRDFWGRVERFLARHTVPLPDAAASAP